MTNVRFYFRHKERQRGKHFCFHTLSFRLCNAHKLYFNVVSKLLPYVALAFADPVFVFFVLHLRNRAVNCRHKSSENVGNRERKRHGSDKRQAPLLQISARI